MSGNVSRHVPWSSAVVLAACVLFLPISAATAQECETPLFVMQSMVGANVMILADNSGSMNEAIYHPGYDAQTAYSGPFVTGATYFVASDGTRSPASFIAGLDTAPVAWFVDSDNGKAGRYQGNYLNWIFYHATDLQRLQLPVVTRIQVLKLILHDILDRSRRLRFGLTVYQNDHGGSIIGKCGVNPSSLHAQIEGITAVAWTPTGEALETILDYFTDDGSNAVIESECQKNFLIIVTDGHPTMDTEVSSYLWDADGDGNDPGDCASIGAPNPLSDNCSDHMDDVAWWLANVDLRPDLPDTQTVSTYVVGFHVDSPLLRDTATNGDGLFFHASNAVELVQSIDYALQDIIRRISSGSAVAVVSTERQDGDYLFRGKFMPLDWHGYLECFRLPYEPGDTPVWEAGELLYDRTPGSRDVFTALGSNVIDFSPGSASTLAAPMGVADATEAARVIRWTLGEDVDGLRPHARWVLGDIVHATPVVVGAPANFSPDEEYQAFYEAHRDRMAMVYVEANDGMLHAFRAADGHEAWAFVPEAVLPELPVVADTLYCHSYTCDQTVAVQDVRLNGVWRTVLVGSQGRGGPGVFAFDITEPENPVLLWQQVVPDGLSFTSTPVICQINNHRTVLVGSGLDEVAYKAQVHAFDLDSGNLLGSKLLSTARSGRNKATAPGVVDLDLDGEMDLAYVADLLGNLWRIDLRSGASPSNWVVSQLFAGSLPVTARPAAAYGDNGEVRVYFGTGAYLAEDDMITLEQNSFYCIRDRHDGSTVTPRQLVDQTTSIRVVGDAPGWYVDLWHREGERVTEPALVVAETVIFTSYAPTVLACVSGGESWLYRMHWEDGGVPNYAGEEPTGRDVSLGEGIASEPVIDLAHGTVVIQSSDSSIHVEDIGVDYARLLVRAWHESYDHVTRPAPAE
ncbi:MAG: PilC/PilY family type IV pilus protein [Candidatus Krumholzibacteriia bacterium]